MHNLAILLTGYSIFSAMLLALTHFRTRHYPEQPQAIIMGKVLMMVLANLQVIHYLLLQQLFDYTHSGLYLTLLFAVAPLFYLFSYPLLHAKNNPAWIQGLHFLPALIIPHLSIPNPLPLAFVIGAVYLLRLAHSVYALRAQRIRFQLELGILSAVFIIALITLILGINLATFDPALFFSGYASAIGFALFLVTLALGLTPQLAQDVTDIARETYHASTLGNIQCDTVIHRMQQRMLQQRVYSDPDLDLAMLAQQLELSSHQLSELINTRMGMGFSRYIREQRVAAAKTMLLAEPSASVLSVGLSVGFTSQSNFYEAFREITGMTPGKFRKISQPHASE